MLLNIIVIHGYGQINFKYPFNMFIGEVELSCLRIGHRKITCKKKFIINIDDMVGRDDAQ